MFSFLCSSKLSLKYALRDDIMQYNIQHTIQLYLILPSSLNSKVHIIEQLWLRSNSQCAFRMTCARSLTAQYGVEEVSTFVLRVKSEGASQTFPVFITPKA